jgi:thioredoxin reductase
MESRGTRPNVCRDRGGSRTCNRRASSSPSAVFIRPVNVPHADGLLEGLGCDVDEAGFPLIDATGRTNTAGVWAAGNVVDPRSQVITSAGAGSAAAIAINADLMQDDVERAVEGR